MQWAEMLRLLFLVVSTVMILALPPCSWSPPLTLVISAWCSGWHLSKPEDIALIHYIDDIMQIGLSEQEVVTIADTGFVLSAAPHNLWDLSSPTRGSNLCPQQWKGGVLTTGAPGNSPRWPVNSVNGFPLCSPPLSGNFLQCILPALPTQTLTLCFYFSLPSFKPSTHQRVFLSSFLYDNNVDNLSLWVAIILSATLINL